MAVDPTVLRIIPRAVVRVLIVAIDIISGKIKVLEPVFSIAGRISVELQRNTAWKAVRLPGSEDPRIRKSLQMPRLMVKFS